MMSVGDFDIDLDALRSKRRQEARYAQRFFYRLGPRDAPRLPLSNQEYRELMFAGGIKQITALYARSLALFHYQETDHPDFETFGSGVVASAYAPYYVLDDGDLQLRFPPRVLRGLGPGLIWSPPSSPMKGISSWPSANRRSYDDRQRIDPWRLLLKSLHTTMGDDGMERIRTETLLDMFEVPQNERTASTCRRLMKLMTEFGWSAVDDVRRYPYLCPEEKVRGFVRCAGLLNWPSPNSRACRR
jgi:hypothetical protein